MVEEKTGTNASIYIHMYMYVYTLFPTWYFGSVAPRRAGGYVEESEMYEMRIAPPDLSSAVSHSLAAGTFPCCPLLKASTTTTPSSHTPDSVGI